MKFFENDAQSPPPGGPTLRLHIGLEHVDDLKADLDRGFAALNAGKALGTLGPHVG
jgi:hypothetical protein